MSIKNALDHLITCDGMGKDGKRAALLELIRKARTDVFQYNDIVDELNKGIIEQREKTEIYKLSQKHDLWENSIRETKKLIARIELKQIENATTGFELRIIMEYISKWEIGFYWPIHEKDKAKALAIAKDHCKKVYTEWRTRLETKIAHKQSLMIQEVKDLEWRQEYLRWHRSPDKDKIIRYAYYWFKHIHFGIINARCIKIDDICITFDTEEKYGHDLTVFNYMCYRNHPV